jgi:hypothetical protein
MTLHYWPTYKHAEPAEGGEPRHGCAPTCKAVNFGQGDDRGPCHEPPEWELVLDPRDGQVVVIRAAGGPWCRTHAQLTAAAMNTRWSLEVAGAAR